MNMGVTQNLVGNNQKSCLRTSFSRSQTASLGAQFLPQHWWDFITPFRGKRCHCHGIFQGNLESMIVG